MAWPDEARARAPSTRRESTWLAVAAFTLLATLSLRHGQDVRVFWTAARRAIAGAALYPASDGFLAYRYAPGTALLFAPLAPLPFPVARLAWLAVMVATGVLVVRALAARGPRPGATTALALAMLSRPLLEEFACGQVNLVVLGMLLLAFRLEDRGRPLAAGALLGAAVALKLAPAVFLADAALRRRGGLLAGAALGLTALALAPLPTFGATGTLDLHRAWLASLAAGASDAVGARGNQSLFGLADRIGLPGWTAALAAAALLAALLAWRAAPERRALLLFALALASPMGWMQNFVTGLPAAFLLATAGGCHVRRAAALAGALLLVPVHDLGGARLEDWMLQASLPLAVMGALLAAAALTLRAAPGGAIPGPAAAERG